MDNRCLKCNHEGEIRYKLGLPLCAVCFSFAPNDPSELDSYVEEKIDGDLLETFRKNADLALQRQKKGMINKASKGIPMSRPAFGYKFENKILIPADNFREVEQLFNEFLEENISLTQLAKRHNLSINGLKKILKNFTYVGKIKFNGQIHDGTHQPIISSILFNKVQNKLENLKIK